MIKKYFENIQTTLSQSGKSGSIILFHPTKKIQLFPSFA
jgi:hypothetical protein